MHCVASQKTISMNYTCFSRHGDEPLRSTKQGTADRTKKCSLQTAHHSVTAGRTFKRDSNFETPRKKAIPRYRITRPAPEVFLLQSTLKFLQNYPIRFIARTAHFMYQMSHTLGKGSVSGQAHSTILRMSSRR